ncbi:MAG: hypothetical protein RQ798_00255 [Candidatus Caldarchaeales archaeon]|jgi:hypothetical protein|nr:hypothetical protein [Candidatus Caldarchaeales archaeon]MDT7914945.1 hypothetical protein [Candidatus Caldarchaeales archaeon]
MDSVPYSEVLGVLRRRLDGLLRKASLYPELLSACQPTARRMRVVEELRARRAQLVLMKPEDMKETSYRIHAIQDRYIPLYRLCRRLRLDIRSINGEVYAFTGITYGGGVVAAYLGERRPIVPSSADHPPISRREFARIYEEIRAYCKRVGENPPTVLNEGAWRRDEFFLWNWDADYPKREGVRFVRVLEIYPFAEAHDFILVAVPTEEEERERAERRERERIRVAAIEELVASAGRVVFEGGGEAVYEVDAASLKRLDWLPVSDVAARAVVVKGGYVFTCGIGVSRPLSYLHALRVLEERGVSASLVASSKELPLPRPLGIRVESLHSDCYYSVIIFPKPLRELPPVRAAKIIRTRNRIILVNP